MIYNKYTAKPLWKDLKIQESTNRNKRKYITAPNPGRDGSKSVPLYKFLLKTSVNRDTRLIKDAIYQGKIKVNDVVVKDLKHPLHYLDYITEDNKIYLTVFDIKGKVHEYHKIIYVEQEYVLPVSKWYIKEGFCMVNTYQNKLFKFESSTQLFQKLRVIDSVIYYNYKTKEYRLSSISEKQEFNVLIKLTGKQMYQKFYIVDRSQYDNKINLNVKRKQDSQLYSKVILSKSIFRTKYLPYFL